MANGHGNCMRILWHRGVIAIGMLEQSVPSKQPWQKRRGLHGVHLHCPGLLTHLAVDVMLLLAYLFCLTHVFSAGLNKGSNSCG